MSARKKVPTKGAGQPTMSSQLPLDHPLSQRVRRSFNELTPGQQRVARLFLEQPYEMAFLPVAAVGQRAHVSDSTVVRLSGALGYDGFPELRQDLQNSLIARMAPLDLLKQRLDQQELHETGAVIDLEIENLRRLRETLAFETVERAARLVLEAERVFVIGMRSGFGVAHSCAHLLQHVLTDVEQITLLGGNLPDRLSVVSEKDVVIVFSTPRYSRQLLQVAEHAHRIGATVIAVTDRVLSPIGRVASLVLPVPVASRAFFPSMIGSLAVVYAISAEVTRRRQRVATDRMSRIEDVSNEFRLLLAADGPGIARISQPGAAGRGAAAAGRKGSAGRSARSKAR